jgi:hypothetical protein
MWYNIEALVSRSPMGGVSGTHEKRRICSVTESVRDAFNTRLIKRIGGCSPELSFVAQVSNHRGNLCFKAYFK